MNFDLDHLEATKQKTFRLVVGYNPAPEGSTEPAEEVGFEILGPNSDEYALAEREAAIEGVQAAEKRRAEPPPAPGSRASAEMLIERTDATNKIVINHCTVGWFGVRRGGKPVKFSKANLEALLKVRPNWRVRILREVENSGNFE